MSCVQNTALQLARLCHVIKIRPSDWVAVVSKERYDIDWLAMFRISKLIVQPPPIFSYCIFAMGSPLAISIFMSSISLTIVISMALSKAYKSITKEVEVKLKERSRRLCNY